MTRKNKNIRSDQSRFLRYRKGEMTGSERNAFERDLQKDAFSEEASEGFESLSPEDMQKDLARLTGKIHARTGRRKNYVLYRIAASVAVLMIISSIFVVVERNSKNAPASFSEQQKVPLTIARSEPVRPAGEEKGQPVQLPQQQARESQREEKKSLITADEKPSENISEPAQNIHKEVAPPEAPEMKIDEEPVRAERRAVADEALARMPAGAAAERSFKKAESATKIRGQVISSEDSMPLPGTSIVIKGTTTGTITDANGNFSMDLSANKDVTLVASNIGMKSVELHATPDRPVEIALQPDVSTLDEVVVVGYGVSRSENEESASYQSPKPLIGKTAFNKYIEANVHRQDSTSGQRAVVVARFRVSVDGSIGSIKILRTPGEEFSREAIRLIQSGPLWKPAMRGGEAVEDSVTLRIVFK